MRWMVAGIAAAVMLVAPAGCGGGTETPFEEAGKEAAAAKQKLHAAVKGFEESSSRYNETLNETWEPARTCQHLREHQLHSSNRVLAQEAADYLREYC